MGRQAQLLHVSVFGNQAESCAQFLAKGRPVGIDGRLDWREWQAQDGSKRESVEIVAESVQFLGGRGDGEGRPEFVRAAAAGVPAGADFGGARRGRRRHPLLGASEWHSRKRDAAPAEAPRRACGPDAAEELLLLPREDRRDRLQEREPAAAVHLREGEDPLAPDHGRVPPAPAPGLARGQAGARDGPPALRLQLGARDGSHPALGRREGGPARRGRRRRARLRAELPAPAAPRRAGDAGEGRASCASASSCARGTRRRASTRRRRSPTRCARPCSASTSPPGPTGPPVRLGDADRHRGRALAHAQDPRSTGARSASTRSSGSAATTCRSQVFQDVDVEVKTLVVPEGGELPPDEELAAMEAAERGEEASAAEAQPEGLEELEAELAAEDEIGALRSPRARARSRPRSTAPCPRTPSTARTPTTSARRTTSRPSPTPR